MNEHGEKLDEKTKTEVSDALEAAKKGTTKTPPVTSPSQLDSKCHLSDITSLPLFLVDPEAEIDALKEAVANLSGASMKIGQAIYAKKGDETNASDDDKKDDNKKEEAQEAEFTEKKK